MTEVSDAANPEQLAAEYRAAREHLRLLSIFHYVGAGLSGIGLLFLVVWCAFFMSLVARAPASSSGAEDHVFFWLFGLVAGGMLLWGLGKTIALILAGRFIARQRHYLFCLVVAGLNCVSVPFGTVLGVFTIVVLARPVVRNMFEHAGERPAAPGTGS